MKKSRKVVIYYCFIVVLIILIGISSFFFTYFLNLRSSDIKLRDLKVNESSKMSFNVKEKGHDDFTYNKDTYDINNVESILEYFNYTLTTSNDIYGDYSYYIVGYLVNNGNIKEIYKSDKTRGEVTGRVINISSTYDNHISQLLNILKSQNNLSDSAVIRYVVKINYNLFSDYVNKTIIESRELTLDIPISDVSKLEKSKDLNIENRIVSNNIKNDELYLVIALEFMGALIMFILIILLILRRINKERDVYHTTLDNIFRRYGNEIVRISELPNLSDIEVLFVQDFDDLLNASGYLREVINYNEVVVNQVTVFIVYNNHKAYCYKVER